MSRSTWRLAKEVTHPEAVNREAATEPLDCRRPGPEGFFATWAAGPHHNLANGIAWDDFHHAIAATETWSRYTRPCGGTSNPHTLYDADGNPAQVMPKHGRAFAVTQTHWNLELRDGLGVRALGQP